MKLCSHPSCDRPHYGKGYCNRHYARLRRTGSADSVRKLANGTTTHWLTTVALTWESDNCLIWPFAVGNHGYGLCDGELAHRRVCEAENGAPPAGLQAAHSCGNQLCVNKRHLRWATRQENEADKLTHGTRLMGESHPLAALSETDVLSIRAAKGPQREIANTYGISQQTVSDIKTRKRWAWL